MSGVQNRTVGPDEGDQRLDRWLRKHFPHLSQGRIEKMCRKGELRVDGGRVKSATRIDVGQMIRVPPMPDEGEVTGQAVNRALTAADVKMIQGTVIYRDEHIIAINKPHGLATQGGTGTLLHVDGLAEALTFGYPEKAASGAPVGQGYIRRLAARPDPDHGRKADREPETPRHPQDLLGRRRRCSIPPRGHDQIRAGEIARPWQGRRG